VIAFRHYPVAAIDLNLGCPAPVVYRKCAGGGLLREPAKLDAILGALREAVSIPFTVKTRIGFDSPAPFDGLLALFAKHAVDLLTVHGRTVAQMYRPGIRYDLIAQAARELPCPVLANGSVHGPDQAVAVLARTGARGLMIIPRVLSRGSSAAAQRSHFASVLEAAVDLPSVIYNSPYYGFQTRAELFFDLRREFPHLVGFKEFGGADSLSYAAEHIAGRSDNVALMVGVDTQVFHGIVNCGACGVITGIGNALPREVLRLVELCQRAAKGDPEARRLALELEGALAPLSIFDEGVDLVLYFKRLMTLEGHKEYALNLNASDVLSPSQERLATRRLETFRAWYARWSGAKD